MNIDIREPTIAQYSIDLNVQTRDFVGNHGGHNLGSWLINVNDPMEFCSRIWSKSIEHIHRGVIFTSNNGILDCEWMPDAIPSIEYIDRIRASEPCRELPPQSHQNLPAQRLYLTHLLG